MAGWDQFPDAPHPQASQPGSGAPASDPWQAFADAPTHDYGGGFIGGVRAMARGVPVLGGLADEGNAAIGAGLDPIVPNWIAKDIPGNSFKERYANALQQQRGMDAEFDQAHPVLSPSLQIAGGLASGGALMKAAPATARAALGLYGETLPAKMLAGALSGATIGAASGFADGEGGFDNRLKAAGEGGAIGTVTGGAVPVAGAVVGGTARKLLGPKAPTTTELKAVARSAYKAVDESGVSITPDGMKRLVGTIESDLDRRGFDVDLHPKTQAALKRLQAAADAPATLSRLEVLRRVTNNAAKANDQSDKAMARITRDHIDDFVKTLGPEDVTGPDSEEAVGNLITARKVWSQMERSSLLDKAIAKAKDYQGAGGYQAGLRKQFGAIVNNERAIARFTPQEQEAIRKVAKGGPVENAGRIVGGLSIRSPYAAYPAVTSTAGASAAFGWPVAAAAATLAGGAELARFGSKVATGVRARAASDLVRRGAPNLYGKNAETIVTGGLQAADLQRLLGQNGPSASQLPYGNNLPLLLQPNRGGR
jgi:hypothetical protein